MIDINKYRTYKLIDCLDGKCDAIILVNKDIDKEKIQDDIHKYLDEFYLKKDLGTLNIGSVYEYILDKLDCIVISSFDDDNDLYY